METIRLHWQERHPYWRPPFPHCPLQLLPNRHCHPFPPHPTNSPYFPYCSMSYHFGSWNRHTPRNITEIAKEWPLYQELESWRCAHFLVFEYRLLPCRSSTTFIRNEPPCHNTTTANATAMLRPL